jgi:predicted RNA-binding protein YlxR (DUF448 family)
MPKEEPVRSCLGCGTGKEKKLLLRFVLAPDRSLVPDIKQRLPGRGAYTCPKADCIRQAVNRRQFSRAFKGEVPNLSADALVATVREAVAERILGYLALANKAGKVISGSDTVQESIKKSNKLALVILSADISEDIGNKFTYLAERYQVPCFMMYEKDRLGALLGKSVRSVVALQPSGFVDAIIKEIDVYRNLSDGGTR